MTAALANRTVEKVEEVVGQLPSLRGMFHAAGFAASVPAGVALVATAHPGAPRWSAAVFAVTLAAVFGVSATYHRRCVNGRSHELWRRLDHSMIFCLIAGTYTPLCLLGMPGSWGVPLLVAAWVIAAIGIVCKLVAFHTAGARASALYAVLGWLAALSIPAAVADTGSVAIALLVAGGVCYVAGAAVLATNRPNPAPRTFGYHELWHTATLAAAAFHLAAIAAIT